MDAARTVLDAQAQEAVDEDLGLARTGARAQGHRTVGPGGAALLWAGARVGLDPTAHVYPATVWVLLIWVAAHAFLGVVMQLYCAARRLARRMDARHDIDIVNVALYWHFVALTALVGVGVVAGFPQAGGA